MKTVKASPIKLRVFLVRWATPAAIYFLLQFFVFDHNPYVLAGWAGFCAGGNLMYYFGGKDRETILAKVYGEGWRDGLATYGAKRWMQERREKAPMN